MSKTDFCRECHKKLNMCNEKIILVQNHCEKAPQVVPAWLKYNKTKKWVRRNHHHAFYFLKKEKMLNEKLLLL